MVTEMWMIFNNEKRAHSDMWTHKEWFSAKILNFERKKEQQLRYFYLLRQKSFWTYDCIQTDLKKCKKDMSTEM